MISLNVILKVYMNKNSHKLVKRNLKYCLLHKLIFYFKICLKNIYIIIKLQNNTEIMILKR